MSNFNENTRVQVPAALHLCKLGYTYLDDIRVLDTQTNIIVDVFLEAVKRLNPSISGSEVSILLSKIVGIANNDDLGREFYQLLSANSGIKLIDYDHPENNDWHVTTELTCDNKDTDDNFPPPRHHLLYQWTSFGVYRGEEAQQPRGDSGRKRAHQQAYE